MHTHFEELPALCVHERDTDLVRVINDFPDEVIQRTI